MEAELYILHIGSGDPEQAAKLALPGDAWMLDDGLYLVRSALSRSRLYHRIKAQLPKDMPLLVAALAGEPKFKGMRAGALKWLRETAGGERSARSGI